MIRSLIIVVALPLLVTSAALAGTAAPQQSQALKRADQVLAEREDAADRACLGNSGSPNKTAQAAIRQCSGTAAANRNEVKQQRDQVQQLLDQLEAGRPVDPAAVDRVLREAGQPD
jgi:TolA-binding protein